MTTKVEFQPGSSPEPIIEIKPGQMKQYHFIHCAVAGCGRIDREGYTLKPGELYPPLPEFVGWVRRADGWHCPAHADKGEE